jgi:hypothetical protein
METGRMKLQKVHICYVILKEDVPVATAPATAPATSLVNNKTPASSGEDITISNDINKPNDNEPPTVTVNTIVNPGRNLLAALDAIIAQRTTLLKKQRSQQKLPQLTLLHR